MIRFPGEPNRDRIFRTAEPASLTSAAGQRILRKKEKIRREET
jgi:hypothetical protein